MLRAWESHHTVLGPQSLEEELGLLRWQDSEGFKAIANIYLIQKYQYFNNAIPILVHKGPVAG